MKAIWLTGLLFVLLMVAYSQVSGKPGEAVKSARLAAATPASAAVAVTETLPAWLLDYVYLHQNRPDDVPIRAMASRLSCPE